MSNESNEAGILIDLFLHDELRLDQAEAFLALLKTDARIGQSLYNNIYLDYLLLKLEKDRKAERFVNDPIKTLEELVAYEKSATPIPQPDIQKKNEPIVQNNRFSFWTGKGKKAIPSAPKKYTASDNLFFGIQLIILIGLIVGFSLSHYWEHKKGDSLDSFHAIARVEEVVSPVWKPGSPSLKRGQGIEQGKIALESGMIKIRLKNQVEIILNGPIDFTLDDPMKTVCDHGIAFFHVPKESTGFEVSTPSISILDRGTEFSIEVDPQKSIVGVHKGMVDLNKNEKKILSLTEKEATQIDLPGRIDRLDWIPDRFLNSTQFAQELQKWILDFTEKRKEKIVHWNKNPDLLVRFDFNNPEKSRVVNTSLAGVEKIPFGTLVGCSSTEGAVSNLQAIRFDNSRDYFSCALPGKERAITLFASVRIDRLDHISNVLLASEQIYEKPGTILWQISKEGSIQFFLNGSDGKRLSFHTDRLLTSRYWNTWINLAVVLDPDRKTISHYIDGELKVSIPWTDPIDLEPGSLMLGNLISPKGQQSQWKNYKYFKGALGQFAIYKRALSPNEIKNLE